MRPRNALPAVLLTGLITAAAAQATPTKHFLLDTPQTLSGALAHGVAVSPDGTLSPLPPLASVASFDEPLGLALAVTADGTAYVGTGHPARIWRVKDGTKSLAGEVGADQITALLVDPSGNLWAATAQPAQLLELSAGASAPRVVSTLPEGNIWDLAWYRGGLVAAAGNPGRLLRLGTSGLELAAAVPDAHARCLAVSGDTLIIGTSGRGLVLRWTGAGPVGAVYDSDFTEIAALTVAPDGAIFAAALTGDPTLGAKPSPKADAEVTVTVSTSGETTPKTDKGSATSEILRITPAGAATTVYRFTKQLAGALAWSDGHLVVGTGVEGELWQITEGAAAQLDTVDASQVVRLAGGGTWLLTQGPVRLMHRTGEPRGTFTSPALDAGQPAHWGAVHVRAVPAAGGGCTIRFRSGLTEEPDATWSDWTAAQSCSAERVTAPASRFLQWQVELAPGKDGLPTVESVAVAYRQVNLPPEVADLTVHPPAEIFLQGPPPSDRIVEVEHPDANGIFTVLDENGSGGQSRLGKRYYRVGYRSVSWKADDPNDDPLEFTVEIQPEGASSWWEIRTHLTLVVLGLDTEALADGLYRFRLTASDAPGNPADPALTRRVSSWFTVDNTPPRVTVVRDGTDWLVTVEDALSPVFKVEWNRDAKRWHPLLPEDGMFDTRRETFRIPVEKGGHVLAVRALDDHYNGATAAVKEQP